MSFSDSMDLVLSATLETLYMTAFSTVFAVLIGLPIGVIVRITDEDSLMPNRYVNVILNSFINIVRSIPFIILMIVLFPLSRIIVGTSIGATAVIVPLSILASPMVARLVANTLTDVEQGLIDASLIMGLSKLDIIVKVMIAECLPQLVSDVSLTVINIIGASAMAGALGGGGLGDVAIRYGFQRFDILTLTYSIIAIVAIVQLVQIFGDRVAVGIRRARGII